MPYIKFNNIGDYWKVCGISALIIIGLIARDSFGININKYLFLLLALIPIVFARIKNVAVFSCFLIPLYIGLPGNLISVFLLVRLLFEAIKNKITIRKTGFILTIIVVDYILLQDFFTDYTEVFHLMAALDFIVLALIMSVLRESKAGVESIVAYSVGNFIAGAVMLSATLAYYSLQELMNPATRLGYTGMLTGNSGASMATSIDPNFYAMNTIASISTVLLLFADIKSKKMKILALTSIIGSTICCLIGLSRTFVILLIVWGVLWLLSQGNLKRNFLVLSIIGLLTISFFQFMPTIADAIDARFNGADMIGGNGRVNLIIIYFNQWFDNILSVLFGIGLFNCHTHCTPLMYLFGLGVVGVMPLFAWFVYQWHRCKRSSVNFTFKSVIPFLLTFLAYSAIPAAGAINYTLPLLVSMIVLVRSQQAEDVNE